MPKYVNCLNRCDVKNLLPKRKPDDHKGSVGKALLLCGSVGYTGAAALSALGALRTGAGLVYLGVPASIYNIEAIKLTEPIVFPLPDHEGMLSSVALDKIQGYLNKVDAVLIGPGLGISLETEKIVKYVLKNYSGPIVLDADGISVMAEHKNILRDRTGAIIITPHEGEYCRFVGVDAIHDRQSSAKNLANELGCITLLKGHRTVITDGDTIYLNMTGNPGMAVGGSGDILSGIIVSLLCQGMSPLHAAACGAWLHGAAGDACAKKMGQYGMIPTDLLTILPRLMK